MRIIDQQLGRILLGVAIVIAILVNVSNPPMTVSPEPENKLNRPVQVKLVKSELATASAEVFYLEDSPNWTQPADRFVFAEPKQTFVFQPVDLDIPPASIARAPQILPDPGPSLEGAATLPRFGDEFAPLTPGGATAPEPGTGPGATGRPGTGATATSGAGTVPPSPVFNPFADQGKKK